MNVEDSQQMSRYLTQLGLSEADEFGNADVVLLNTCSVRKKPEDKAFSLLGILKKQKEENPKLIIGVCGCMAQLRASEIHRRAPHVDFVVGTSQISEIPALVAEARQRRRFSKRLELPERKGAVVTNVPARNLGDVQINAKAESKLKAFVPIQYGCDKFCTFCIVPTTRGRERSRPTDEILSEIAQLAALGTKEVMLLGQTVNSYGKNLLEGKVPFAKLLWQISELPGIERIRYTSPYPRDFRDDLIEAHEKCPAVMEHCHLPLQSGDDEVLREMKRQYTVESFTKIYGKLRAIPGIAITTDIIVGFPGETDEQFLNTLATIESLRFDGAFMFAYSPRPGTPAESRADQVPAATKKRRLAELIALQNRITLEIHNAQLGTVQEVLVEGLAEKQPQHKIPTGHRWLKGVTRNFKTVHFSGPVREVGRIAQVRVESCYLWGLQGELVRRESQNDSGA